jgi:ornithine cyclodeaminase
VRGSKITTTYKFQAHSFISKKKFPRSISMSSPKIFNSSEIERITKDSSFDRELIDAIAQGYADFSLGKFNLCPIQTMGAPPLAPFSETVQDYAAQVCVKSGYITGDPYFVIKVAAGGRPLPHNTGLMQVFSQSTGKLEALLLDEGLLTELRTAAAGAVAVKFLGPEYVTRIGIVGTGIQARYQLRYLRQVTSCRNLVIWGRTKEHAEALKTELKDEWNVDIADNTQELLDTCNIIITTTCSRQALLHGPVSASLLLVCIGADSVGKQELSSNLVANADLLVCDSRIQTQERGEYQHALREVKITLESIKEIGEIIVSSDLSPNRKLTIFDSSGVAIQDCIVAKMVYLKLLRDL